VIRGQGAAQPRPDRAGGNRHASRRPGTAAAGPLRAGELLDEALIAALGLGGLKLGSRIYLVQELLRLLPSAGAEGWR
jgi:hypothetical protein